MNTERIKIFLQDFIFYRLSDHLDDFLPVNSTGHELQSEMKL